MERNHLKVYAPSSGRINPFFCLGKACSAEFMRRIERMVQAHEGKKQDLVKFIAHQTCISPSQIYRLVQVVNLKKEIRDIAKTEEEPQPSILIESLTAPNPIAMATKAIEEEWTAKEVRQEVAKQKEAAICEAIEPLEEKMAKERQERKPISSGKFPPQEKGQSRDKVAKYVGKSAKTMKKATAGQSQCTGRCLLETQV
jgi:hypothetical protein